MVDQSMRPDEVFERLEPLLKTQGTQYSVDGDALTYHKINPAAQDKLATFTSGTLWAQERDGVTRLSYDVGSTALMLVFLAPLAFLAFAQFSVLINELEKPALLAEMAEEEKKKEKEDEEQIELHWIDKLLGAPDPNASDKEDEEEKARDRSAREGAEDEEEEPEGNHSPETAYVFAGIFFAIYLVGRFLEPYLLKRTLRAALTSVSDPQPSENKNDIGTGKPLAP